MGVPVNYNRIRKQYINPNSFLPLLPIFLSTLFSYTGHNLPDILGYQEESPSSVL